MSNLDPLLHASARNGDSALFPHLRNAETGILDEAAASHPLLFRGKEFLKIEGDLGTLPVDVVDDALKRVYRFLHTLVFQLCLIAVAMADFALLVLALSNASCFHECATLATGTMLFLAMVLDVGEDGLEYFRRFRWWRVAEVILLSTSFVAEYVAFLLVERRERDERNDPTAAAVLLWIRALRGVTMIRLWGPLAQSGLRRFVAADRRRFITQGYDFDLTYICVNVIAMSWPSTSVEGCFRNDINTIALFFKQHYPMSYRVYNLCSERRYNEQKFEYQVVRYPMDDHNPVELIKMLQFAFDASSFLAAEPSRNVIVVHCKGGKGRTGTMICALLLYAGVFSSSPEARKYFGTRRMQNCVLPLQAVAIPSQERYVDYFAQLIQRHGCKLPQRRVVVASMSLLDVPVCFLFEGIDRLWFVLISEPTERRLLRYCSNPHVTFTPQLCADPTEDWISKEGRERASLRPLRSTSWMERWRLHAPSCAPFGEQYSLLVTPRLDENSAAAVRSPFSESAAKAPLGPFSTAEFHAWVKHEQELSKRRGRWASRWHRRTCANDHPFWARWCVDLHIDPSAIPPLEDDTVLKFFYNVDNPHTTESPMQCWFHTAFEKDRVSWTKSQLDGPHSERDGKEQKYRSTMRLELTFRNA